MISKGASKIIPDSANIMSVTLLEVRPIGCDDAAGADSALAEAEIELPGISSRPFIGAPLTETKFKLIMTKVLSFLVEYSSTK
jgi:hypothetical protein